MGAHLVGAQVQTMAAWIMSLSVGLSSTLGLKNLQSRIGASEQGFGKGGLRCWPQRTKSSN